MLAGTRSTDKTATQRSASHLLDEEVEMGVSVQVAGFFVSENVGAPVLAFVLMLSYWGEYPALVPVQPVFVLL